MQIYNTITNQKEVLDTSQIITIYNCGPTVYNDIHIGNLRPAITFDLLIRFLKAQDISVKYVHNITDIDDKIIQKAISENTSESLVAEKYTKAYLSICQQMNLLAPDHLPKVSENITGIIEYIQLLVDTKIAYFNGEDVLFDVNQIPDYGIISKQQTEHLKQNQRAIQTSQKQNEHDFVLWKKTSVGLTWNSPWQKGRPGWHTECAYFVYKYIGEQVFIHGGGMDLKFPHHENENAQNLALFKKPLAKIWMHIGVVNVDGVKMSKSLNNFLLVKNVLNQYSANILRWFFFQTGYQNPLNFSDEIMSQTAKTFDVFVRTINQAKTWLYLWNKQDIQLTKLSSSVVKALNDDLNLPNVIEEWYLLKQNLNYAIKEKNLANLVFNLKHLLSDLIIMGFEIDNLHNEQNLALIAQWNKTLLDKNFQVADQLRKELITKGLL